MLMIRQRMLLCLALLCLTLAGCGGARADRPPMGYVSGTVTKDGKPVSTVTVVMKPDVGRPAMGVTNDKGYYEMEYTLDEKGTKIGPTSVSLEWPTGFAAPFGIPRRYAAGNKEYKLDVKAGKQTYDIVIEADAEKATDKKGKEKPPVIVD